MAFQLTDNLVHERAGTHYRGTVQELAEAVNQQIGNVHPAPAADIAARDAVTGLSPLDIVHVTDDGTGQWARYQATAVDAAGMGTAWELIASQSQLTSVNSDLGYTPSPTDGTVTNSAGNDATIPLGTGTNAGLLSPADFDKLGFLSVTAAADVDQLVTDSHVPAVTAGTATTNPIIVDAATQSFSFDIAGLAVAP